MDFFDGEVTGNNGFLMAGRFFLGEVSLSHDFAFIGTLAYLGGDELVVDADFTSGLAPLAFIGDRGDEEALTLTGFVLELGDWPFFITSACRGLCLRSLKNLGINCFLDFAWPLPLEKSISQAVLPSLTALLGIRVWSSEEAETELPSPSLSSSPQPSV